ncbi:MAG TPA: hypothetical protein GX506_00305, partial [Firmicutes bacterium]|nr:hypothetical protein [Bacillota bacterium]
GSTGMVGGQAMEMDFRRRGRMSLGDSCGIRHLESLARLKTGALFVASVRCGALVAGATHDQLSMLTRFAENIGLAFQIVDDILDKDKDLGQSQQPGESPWPVSFPDILDTEDARKYAIELTRAGLDAIEILGAKADPLRQLTMELLERAG